MKPDEAILAIDSYGLLRMTAASESGEPSLLSQARNGDTQAFEALLRRHEQPVLRLATRLLGSSEDARDVAQEVFLRFHRHLATLRDGCELGPWLYRVTVNVCYDAIGRRRPAVSLEDVTLPVTGVAADAAIHQEDRRRALLAGLATLPAKERAAIVLRDMEGLSTARVAEILSSSETTVRSQISTGRMKLRRFIEAAAGRNS